MKDEQKHQQKQKSIWFSIVSGIIITIVAIASIGFLFFLLKSLARKNSSSNVSENENVNRGVARHLLQLPSDSVKTNQVNNVATSIPNNQKFYDRLPSIYVNTRESLLQLANACNTSIKNFSTEESCQFVLSNPDLKVNTRMGGVNEHGNIIPNDPHKTCNTPLIEAVFDEQPTKNLRSFIKKAIKAKKVIDLTATDISGKNVCVVIAGVKNNYAESNLKLVLELAKKQGNDIKKLVNQPDRLGRTPLMIAAGVGNKEIVTLLLANGADLNATDKNGNNVIHYAALNKEQKEFLLHNEFGIHPYRAVNALMDNLGLAINQEDPDCSMLIGWQLSSLPFPKDEAQKRGFDVTKIEDASNEIVGLLANRENLEKIKVVYNEIAPDDESNKEALKRVIEQNKNLKKVTVIEDSLNQQNNILKQLVQAGAQWKKNKYGQFPNCEKPVLILDDIQENDSGYSKVRLFNFNKKSYPDKTKNQCLLIS